MIYVFFSVCFSLVPEWTGVKRGRGRPRKYSFNSSDSNNLHNSFVHASNNNNSTYLEEGTL